jgi:hypothetical protein
VTRKMTGIARSRNCRFTFTFVSSQLEAVEEDVNGVCRTSYRTSLIIGDCGSGWPVHHGSRVTKFVHYRRRSISDIVISPNQLKEFPYPLRKGAAGLLLICTGPGCWMRHGARLSFDPPSGALLPPCLETSHAARFTSQLLSVCRRLNDSWSLAIPRVCRETVGSERARE